MSCPVPNLHIFSNTMSEYLPQYPILGPFQTPCLLTFSDTLSSYLFSNTLYVCLFKYPIFISSPTPCLLVFLQYVFPYILQYHVWMPAQVPIFLSFQHIVLMPSPMHYLHILSNTESECLLQYPIFMFFPLYFSETLSSYRFQRLVCLLTF